MASRIYTKIDVRKHVDGDKEQYEIIYTMVLPDNTFIRQVGWCTDNDYHDTLSTLHELCAARLIKSTYALSM